MPAAKRPSRRVLVVLLGANIRSDATRISPACPFARQPWLDGCGQAAAGRGVAGAEGAAVLDAIGGAQRHLAGIDGRQLACGEPGSHQDQPDTACCLCARRQRRQRHQQSGGVGGRVGRAMAGAGGRRRRPGRRQAHTGRSVGPGDCLDQRSTRCQRVWAAPASPAACCPHEGTACRGRGAWRP